MEDYSGPFRVDIRWEDFPKEKLVDFLMMEMYTRFFSPGIKVRALSIPPESEGSGVCCEWEFIKQ